MVLASDLGSIHGLLERVSQAWRDTGFERPVMRKSALAAKRIGTWAIAEGADSFIDVFVALEAVGEPVHA